MKMKSTKKMCNSNSDVSIEKRNVKNNLNYIVLVFLVDEVKINRAYKRMSDLNEFM